MAVVNYLTIDGEIVSEYKGNNDFDYIPDIQGSIVNIVNTSQQITDTYRYWPYGEVRSHIGTNPTPFQYGGALGYHTDTTGHIYIGARVLDPVKTNWITVDPTWPDELPYTYANASPISYTDATGNSPRNQNGGSIGNAFWKCMNDPNLQSTAPQQRCAFCKNQSGSSISCAGFAKALPPSCPPPVMEGTIIIAFGPSNFGNAMNFRFKACMRACMFGANPTMYRNWALLTCQGFCGVTRSGGCNALWNLCWRQQGNYQKQACLALFTEACSGE